MNENLTDYCYRKLKFTDNQLKNFQLQLCALKENKDICSCLKSYKKSKKNNVFYILLSFLLSVLLSIETIIGLSFN